MNVFVVTHCPNYSGMHDLAAHNPLGAHHQPFEMDPTAVEATSIDHLVTSSRRPTVGVRPAERLDHGAAAAACSR